MRSMTSMSPFNTFPEVTKDVTFSPDLTLCDCTLRDGEQQAGVVFTKEDKVAIAKLLDEMRIPEIEAGMPCNSQEDADAIKAVVDNTVIAVGYSSDQITSIINEEAAYYFNGEKSAQDVAATIQNRVSIYVSEQS